MLKSFFVAFNRSPHALAALETTCFLAALTRGRVHLGHIVEIVREPVIATGMLAGTIETMAVIPPVDAIREVEAFRRESEAHARSLFEQARAVCQRWGVDCTTECLSGYVEEEVVREAQAVDLVAIGQSGAGEARRRIGAMADAIGRASPQPVLLATAPFVQPREIVVLYDGTERTFHALSTGAGVARLAGLPVTLITAPASKEECEAIHKRACQYLGDYELECHPMIIKPHDDVDRELAAIINARPAALVMLSVFGGPRLRQWLLGNAARSVVEQIRNPVVMFRI